MMGGLAHAGAAGARAARAWVQNIHVASAAGWNAADLLRPQRPDDYRDPHKLFPLQTCLEVERVRLRALRLWAGGYAVGDGAGDDGCERGGAVAGGAQGDPPGDDQPPVVEFKLMPPGLASPCEACDSSQWHRSLSR